MSRETILNAYGISKAFGPTRALIDVDIELRRGEIRGLIGENGSGKSTFSSILAGAQKQDSGHFVFKGRDYKPENMVDAQQAGVSMIIQETGVIPGIDVTSNIFAGNLNRFSNGIYLNWKRAHREANRILAEIGASDIIAEEPIDLLNFEDKKIVEIARAMSSKPDLLIVDETTTALATKGRHLLYEIMRKMKSEDKTVLFIGHDLDELIEICDSVTVLRDGLVIDTLEEGRITTEAMRSLMVGRQLVGSFYREDFDGSVAGEVVLRAEQLSLRPFFKNVSFKLHKGEILGIGGLAGSGMHEVGKVLFGCIKPLTGSVVLTGENEKPVRNSVSAVAHKMAYIPKDRDKESVILNASVQSNVVLPSLRSMKGPFQYISKKRERQLTDRQTELMRIKCRNRDQSLKELSGGNKQKVVFSKWLGTDSQIFVMDCPTRGIDVGVKADMYKLMMELKQQGKSIIMISEELLELIGMSDRILIMKDGAISKEFKRSKQLTESDIIEYMI